MSSENQSKKKLSQKIRIMISVGFVLVLLVGFEAGVQYELDQWKLCNEMTFGVVGNALHGINNTKLGLSQDEITKECGQFDDVFTHVMMEAQK